MDARDDTTTAPVATFLVAQLTDTHVVAADPTMVDAELQVDNNARLAAAVASLGREPIHVAAVVATGDLTNDGRPEEYDALEELLAPVEAPILPLPGNHDDPDEIRRRFPDVPWAADDHASWATEVGPVRIVGLDTTRLVDGRIQHGGAVDRTRLAWLGGVLGERHDGPTVLAMHHPPFESGVWWMDSYGFDGLDALVGVLDERPVDRIVCGHLHRPMTTMVAGAIAQVGMSTVQHVGLDLVPDRDITVVDDPSGYQLLQIRGEGADSTMVMHHRYVEPAGAPVTPSWSHEFR